MHLVTGEGAKRRAQLNRFIHYCFQTLNCGLTFRVEHRAAGGHHGDRFAMLGDHHLFASLDG